MTKFQFEAIGTFWQIDIEDDLPHNKEVVLLDEIKSRISEFDKVYSRFRKDSLVTQMSEKSGEYDLPEDADLLINTYKTMYDATEGKVTPLIGGVLSDAGYDANYSFKESELTVPKKWEEVIEWNNPRLLIKEPAILDFGAGGKGYLVDIVSEILERHALQSYCVDAGGDMRQRARGGNPLRVGLENPEDMSEVVGVANLLNKSLCGSSGSRRKWGRFNHIIDPEKLSSPTEILAVWVIADTTLTADILTTGLFFVSPHVLLNHFKFEYLILYSDRSVEQSSGFDAELFTV